jgi:hypothetical protein
MAEAWEQIDGAKEFVAWFGRWPQFHDSEIVHLHLNRMASSSLLLYAFDGTPEVDEKGFYRLVNHVLVDFQMEEITELELEGFSIQNVLQGLSVEQNENGTLIKIHPCFGMSGSILSKRIALRFTPIGGPPTDR